MSLNMGMLPWKHGVLREGNLNFMQLWVLLVWCCSAAVLFLGAMTTIIVITLRPHTGCNKVHFKMQMARLSFLQQAA